MISLLELFASCSRVGLDVLNSSTLILVDKRVPLRSRLLDEVQLRKSKAGLLPLSEVEDEDEVSTAPYSSTIATGLGYASKGYSTTYTTGYPSVSTYAMPRREAGLTIRTKNERDKAAAKAATDKVASAAPAVTSDEKSTAFHSIPVSSLESASLPGGKFGSLVSTGNAVVMYSNPVFAASRRAGLGSSQAASTKAAASGCEDAEGTDAAAVYDDIAIFDSLK